MRTFDQFVNKKSNDLESKIAQLIITTESAVIQDSLREVFEKYIAESDDKVSILNLYRSASIFLETEVAAPTATGPAQSYRDPTDLSGYIGKLADSVISHAKKSLGADKIDSHFLSELLNAIVKRSGKNIVDPERGGQAFKFSSTHTQDPNEVETLTKKWEDIPDRYKAHYLFNLAKYYYKYLRDPDQAFDKVKKSIDPASLTNNTQKGNFTRALTQARQWWDSQQNTQNVPMSPYKEPPKPTPVEQPEVAPLTKPDPDDREFQAVVKLGASMLEKGMDFEQMRTAIEAKHNLNKVARPHGGRIRLWAAIKHAIQEKYPQLGGNMKNIPKPPPEGKLRQDPHINARMADLANKLGQQIKDRADGGQYKFGIPLNKIVGDVEPNSVNDPKILNQYAAAFKQHLEDEFGGEYAWGMYPTVDARKRPTKTNIRTQS